MEEKHSRLGIASFALSLIVGFLLLAVFVTAGILSQRYGTRGGQYPGAAAVGVAAILLFGADLVAITLGIVSVCQRERKRLFGVLGLVFSSLTLLLAGGLMLVGIFFAAAMHGR